MKAPCMQSVYTVVFEDTVSIHHEQFLVTFQSAWLVDTAASRDHVIAIWR